jgi:hypothetical protein
VKSLNHLASVLHFPKKKLLDVAEDFQDHYDPFPKEVGGKIRRIHNPQEPLKTIQRRINTHILYDVPICEAFYGGVPGCDIYALAAIHVGKDIVITLDVRDHYPSIGNSRVFQFFLEKLRASRDVASVLTKLTTFEHQLPHGAPTSRALANRLLDPVLREIQRILEDEPLTAGQWVDGTSISGTVSDSSRLGRILERVCKVFTRHGFAVHRHEKKFRIMRRGRQQEVVGLSVVRQATIPRRKRREVRAAVHKLSTLEPNSPGYAKQYQHTAGKIGSLRRLHPAEARRYDEQLAELPYPTR